MVGLLDSEVDRHLKVANRNMTTGIKDYEGKDYASFWQGEGKGNLNKLEWSIIKRLLPEKGNWLVDLGCGFGRYSDLYVRNYDHVVLVDYSISLLRQAKTKFGGSVSYVAANVYHLPFRNEIFDVSLMVRVIHHLSAPQLALKEVRRILRGEGTFIFNFSNKRNLAQLFKFVLGLSRTNPFSLDTSEYGDLLFGHHPKYMLELLAKEQLVVRESLGAGVLDKGVDLLPAKIADSMPAGKLLSVILGKVLLGPIVFWQTKPTPWRDSKNKTEQYADVIEILVCPSCKRDLVSKDKNLSCVNCGHVYQIVDGIYDLRVEQ